MSPLLGIWASSIQGSKATSFDSIATTTVGAGGTSTITFSSIPSTYKHLQIRSISRNSFAGNGVEIGVFRFNSDSGSNYARHVLYGSGTAAGSTAATSTTAIYAGAMYISGDLSNTFGACIVDILDYANTNKYKTVRVLEGLDDNNGTSKGQVALRSGLWMNTNAINTITITASNSANFVQYSQFALYGIK